MTFVNVFELSKTLYYLFIYCMSIFYSLSVGPWYFPGTPSPSHQVKLLMFLLLVMFFRKLLIGLFMVFRSSPPRSSQLLLAWDQFLDSPTNSKHTFFKINSQSIGWFLPWQTSEFSSEYRNPNEIHKKMEYRSIMSIVIITYRAKTHNASGTVAERATEENQFCLSYEN